jgi:hypothetical protein
MLLTISKTAKPQVWISSYYLPEALPDALSEKKKRSIQMLEQRFVICGAEMSV